MSQGRLPNNLAYSIQGASCGDADYRVGSEIEKCCLKQPDIILASRLVGRDSLVIHEHVSWLPLGKGLGHVKRVGGSSRVG